MAARPPPEDDLVVPDEHNLPEDKIRHWAGLIDAALRKKMGDEFVDLMKKTNTVISGSFILQVIYDESWPGSDIDFFTPGGGMCWEMRKLDGSHEMGKYLWENCIHLYGKDSMSHPVNWQIGRSWREATASDYINYFDRQLGCVHTYYMMDRENPTEEDFGDLVEPKWPVSNAEESMEEWEARVELHHKKQDEYKAEKIRIQKSRPGFSVQLCQIGWIKSHQEMFDWLCKNSDMEICMNMFCYDGDEPKLFVKHYGNIIAKVTDVHFKAGSISTLKRIPKYEERGIIIERHHYDFGPGNNDNIERLARDMGMKLEFPYNNGRSEEEQKAEVDKYFKSLRDSVVVLIKAKIPKI